MRPQALASIAVALAVCALCISTSAPTRAQTEGAAGTSSAVPPSITPPLPKRNEGAVYPKRALDEGFVGDVQVSVLVTVGADGVVTDAAVERSVGHGFDEAAVDAARHLVFEPATRDGTPIAARTRIVYKFSPPAGALSGRVLSIASD